MNPGDIVPLSFHAGVVALSFMISVLGSYVALLAAVGIRTEMQDGEIRIGYIIIGALAMGGVGIWSMHFIGMQAQELPFEVGYQTGLTALSFLVAAGLGVAAMHYVGISAMRMPAVFMWDLPMVVLSVLIAVIAASAALWLAFNTQNEFQRAAAAILMAVAVCGMHYTGVAAGTVVCTTPREFSSMQIGGVMLPYIAFALSAVMLLVMRWHLQRASRRFRARLAQRIDSIIESAPAVEGGRAPGSPLGPG